MDRRLIAAGLLLCVLIGTTALLLTRPIVGTWVCTDRLTEHAMLSDEVTTITVRPDGTADFRSYATYLIGRYRIQDGSGRWEHAGFEKYRITLMQGTVASCSLFENCTNIPLAPLTFAVEHNRLMDTISYDPTAAPEFSGIRPFVRSLVTDCSGPQGCQGY